MPQLTIGEIAPDFELPSHGGRKIRLSDFKGKKPVVLFFYPKDETPGCTAESCAFRDHYEEFQKIGAEVIGVSSDSLQSHARFASKHRLPFLLLSDEGGSMRKLYQVPSTLGFLPGRVTFVIDKQGKIIHTFNSQFRATRHVEEALQVLRGQVGSFS